MPTNKQKYSSPVLLVVPNPRGHDNALGFSFHAITLLIVELAKVSWLYGFYRFLNRGGKFFEVIEIITEKAHVKEYPRGKGKTGLRDEKVQLNKFIFVKALPLFPYRVFKI